MGERLPDCSRWKNHGGYPGKGAAEKSGFIPFVNALLPSKRGGPTAQSRFTAEAQRTPRECFSAPIGPSPRHSGFVHAGGRWRLEHNLRPFGIRLNTFLNMAPIVGLLIIDVESFCLSASPDKQKLFSLRARRLCGEISILGKHVKPFLMKGGWPDGNGRCI